MDLLKPYIDSGKLNVVSGQTTFEDVATLARYLAFRGLGTAILSANSSTGSISLSNEETYLALFSGKLFSTPVGQMNLICIIVGIVARVLVVLLGFTTRARRLKKGYEADSLVAVILKSALGVAAIMLFAYKLAMSGGIPTVLVWVVGATLIGVINLGMSLMGVNADWQKIVKGLVLLGAVVFDILAAKKSASK